MKTTLVPLLLLLLGSPALADSGDCYSFTIWLGQPPTPGQPKACEAPYRTARVTRIFGGTIVTCCRRRTLRAHPGLSPDPNVGTHAI